MKRMSLPVFAALLALLALPGLAGPNYATWSASLKPADTRAGESAQLVVVAKMQKPWHLYSLTQPPGGPIKTTIELQPGSVLTAGKPVQPKPKSKLDPGFNITTEYFEGTVAFGIPVTVRPDAKGQQTAKLKVRYQLCNESSCLPPVREEITVRFTVAPGAARANRKKPVTAVPKVAAWQDEGTQPFYGGTLILAQDRTEGGPPAAPASPAPSAPQQGDEFTRQIEQAKSRGLLAYLWFSVIAGFLALLTPCVFPMIPITVSYFTKRKEQGTNLLAGPVAYCLGIIATFTGLGLLVTLLFGATGISKFATNPWINLALAALFIALAANLLGVYEIVIPSGLADKAHAGSRRGGLIGPLLLGFAFTITSFTCTVPFVGTLLVTATQGHWFYPLIGMLAFSTAFALPFFLLALFPQYLARMPRSGSWLVTVKAYMGMLELAAALKFLSNADIVWQFGWITRPVFLAVWAMLGIIAGLYLLGWIRFPHDDTTKIGWIRRSIGAATAALGVYCLAAIQGAPLGEFEAFPPPADYVGRRAAAASVKPTVPGAEKTEVVWLSSYEEALSRARAENRPIFIDFTGVTCTNCRWMEKNIFPMREVQQELAQYITVKLYTDRDRLEDEQNQALQEKLTGVVTLPVYVMLTPDGRVTKVQQGMERDAAKFVRILQEGRAGAALTSAQGSI